MVNTKNKLQPNKQSQNRFAKSFSKYKYFYLLMLPGIIYFIVFRYIPLGGLVIAFKDYRFVDGIWGSEWVGFEHFQDLFNKGDFMEILGNTLTISILKLIFGFPAPIILALMLNEVRSQTFKRVVQTIVYLPHFISWVVLSGIIIAVLSPSTGILQFFGIDNPMMSSDMFPGFLVVTSIWKEVGWGTVVYLAALSGIDQEIYEAARIDGAGRLQQIFFITLPSIRSTIAVLLIMRTGSILNVGFEQIFTLYSPLVYDVADVISTYVYRIGLTEGQFSLASAAGVFQSVVGFVLIIISNTIVKRLGEEGLL